MEFPVSTHCRTRWSSTSITIYKILFLGRLRIEKLHLSSKENKKRLKEYLLVRLLC